jgi:hypothetical protein
MSSSEGRDRESLALSRISRSTVTGLRDDLRFSNELEKATHMVNIDLN